MFKAIRKQLSELRKDIIFFIGADKPDLDNMPTMHRDPNAPIEPPVICIAKGGPRIKYKHR